MSAALQCVAETGKPGPCILIPDRTRVSEDPLSNFEPRPPAAAGQAADSTNYIFFDDRDALVLSGGGARGAYQVGVLKAMAEWLPEDAPCPFEVLIGASAGALNASGPGRTRDVLSRWRAFARGASGPTFGSSRSCVRIAWRLLRSGLHWMRVTASRAAGS